MTFLNLFSNSRRANRTRSYRPNSRKNAYVPALESLERREVLDGMPFLNARSSTQQLFVESLFEGLLQRPADISGMNYWTTAMNEGAPPQLVVLAFEQTPEFSSRQVDQFYSTILNRSAGSSERAYWTSYLQRGGSVEQMEAAFLASPEFSGPLGDTGLFLHSLYQNALSRPLDIGALQAWSQALLSGVPRGQIVSDIVLSNESRTLFVQGLYARFLSRTGMPSELQSWVAALAAGASQQQVFAQIAGSPEAVAIQAAGVLAEIASGTQPGGIPSKQQLIIQFNPGTSATSVQDALQWIDGSLAPGSPTSAGNAPATMIVNVPARRTLRDAARLIEQHPGVRSALPDVSPVSNLASAISWLDARSTTMIHASSVPMANGVTAFLPQAGLTYNGFWLRDFAYMLEGDIDAFSFDQLENAGQMFINSMRGDGAGVDSVGLNGTPYYMPNSGLQGVNPVADGSQFTIDIAWRIYQRTGNLAFVQRNLVALQKGLDVVPINPANGLVYADSTRSSYGFTDLVPKRGDDLFCSLLLIRAQRQMADLYTAVGAPDVAAKLRASGDRLVDAVRSVFWNAQTGLFMAATIQCVQPDIWGSAFAVYLGVATPNQSLAIANYFKNHYSEIVYHGQLRELPGGMYWENYPGPKDQYQNGGYWATPIGWFVYTLDQVDSRLADRTVIDMVQDFYVNGVYENVHGNSEWARDYNSSAALPLAGIQAMLQKRQNEGT
jgi:hypothetical protein